MKKSLASVIFVVLILCSTFTLAQTTPPESQITSIKFLRPAYLGFNVRTILDGDEMRIVVITEEPTVITRSMSDTIPLGMQTGEEEGMASLVLYGLNNGALGGDGLKICCSFTCFLAPEGFSVNSENCSNYLTHDCTMCDWTCKRWLNCPYGTQEVKTSLN